VVSKSNVTRAETDVTLGAVGVGGRTMNSFDDEPLKTMMPRWSTGEWTACNVSCGKGARQRAYWCQEESGLIVNRERCSSQQIPLHR
jgi:hypothetical protein